MNPAAVAETMQGETLLGQTLAKARNCAITGRLYENDTFITDWFYCFHGRNSVL
jgi:hypothetical protein